ncbi:MAG: ferritin-like domain-containing protein [Deltaproteobacteria bacterium]|nr:ferritin-like domain-containing protein [Nannocystaceae bacterium]
MAAFARLAIDLMVHGAPAELVDAAHVAARDEIRHAQHCYGIASVFGGKRLGPGALALSASASPSTLEQLAVECFRDGCVNETVAALCVAEGSRCAASPAIRDTLAAIADDEARHAELSYRILAWALNEGDASLRGRIAIELDLVRDELVLAPTAGVAHPDHDASTGLLDPRTAAAVRRRVLAEVVIPCTEALLAGAQGHMHSEIGVAWSGTAAHAIPVGHVP